MDLTVKQPTAESSHGLRLERLPRRLLANSGWLLASDATVSALRLAQAIILARMLGAEKFGILALIQTYSTTVNDFVSSRVGEGVIKFVTKFLEEKRGALATAFLKLGYIVDGATGTIAYLLTLATAGVAAHLVIKHPEQTTLLRFYALTLLVTAPLGTSDALLRVSNRFDWIACQNIGGALLRLTCIAFIGLRGGGLRAVVSVYVLSGVAMTGSALILARRASRSLLSVPWREAPIRNLKSESRDVTKFLLSTNGNYFFKLLNRNADILLIGYFLTPVAVAWYRVARMVTDMMVLPVNPLENASYPEFVRLWHQGKRRELRNLVLNLTIISGTLAILELVFLWTCSRWVIDLSVGSQFLPALPALRVLAVGVAVAIATCFGYPLLLAVGKVSSTLLAIGLGVAVQVPLLFALIPRVGIVGAAMSYVVFYLVWVAVVLQSAWRAGLQK